MTEAKYEGHGCEHGVAHKLGDVVTVNCTMLNVRKICCFFLLFVDIEPGKAGVTSDHG
jgi:hypothetical protein